MPLLHCILIPAKQVQVLKPILAQGELGQLVGAVNIWAPASLPGGRAFSLLKVLKVKNFVCTFMSAHFS